MKSLGLLYPFAAMLLIFTVSACDRVANKKPLSWKAQSWQLYQEFENLLDACDSAKVAQFETCEKAWIFWKDNITKVEALCKPRDKNECEALGRMNYWHELRLMICKREHREKADEPDCAIVKVLGNKFLEEYPDWK